MKEKRSARRQPMRYSAWVAPTPKHRFGCLVSDVSQTGARIDMSDAKEVPDTFVLLLSSNGAARRFCRVVWRKPQQIGVKFERSFAEAVNAARAAKGETQAAPAEPAEPVKTA